MEKNIRDIENLKTWNKVASLYAEKMMDLPIYEESYKMFRELLHRLPVIQQKSLVRRAMWIVVLCR